MLNIKEAAERLRLSTSQLYLLVSKKRIAHYRDGAGPIRFSEKHVEDYLESIEHGRGETWPADGRLRRLKI